MENSNRNHKQNGEKGERIAIGCLAKFNIDVALPMSDNHSFDFIVIRNNKLYKVQVKSSGSIDKNGGIHFHIKKNNWYNKTCKKYTRDDVDVVILCDYETIYLLKPEEFENRSFFCISKTHSTNGGPMRNHYDEYVISYNRIEDVFS